MRSEHNHSVDKNAYENFLKTAIQVRKFSKKKPAENSHGKRVNSTGQSVEEIDSYQDIVCNQSVQAEM